jgi:hypothetical protein
MKIPFAAAPALTRAQIDAIVSSSVVPPDAPLTESQTRGLLYRDVACARDEVSRSAQTSVKTAGGAAAAYGCVDWYIYPDSHGESDSASEAA